MYPNGLRVIASHAETHTSPQTVHLARPLQLLAIKFKFRQKTIAKLQIIPYTAYIRMIKYLRTEILYIRAIYTPDF